MIALPANGLTRAIFAAAVTAAALTIPVPAAMSNPPTDRPHSRTLVDCSGSVGNPHVSMGANGVIYKSNVSCTTSTTVTVYQNLYRCSSNPGTTDPASVSGCYVVVPCRAQSRTVGSTTAVFYCPPSGELGFQGYGWLSGRTEFYWTGGSEVRWKATYISPWRVAAPPLHLAAHAVVPG